MDHTEMVGAMLVPCNSIHTSLFVVVSRTLRSSPCKLQLCHLCQAFQEGLKWQQELGWRPDLLLLLWAALQVDTHS